MGHTPAFYRTFLVWASIKLLHHRDGKSTPKNQTHRSIIRFSTIQHARHLAFDHVPITQLRIEILQRILYLDGKLYALMTDDMFKLAII